ncbi:MAG: Card1-like endonuclease domain-containing protein [Cyclobacteriaceae bacterium]
MKILVSIVSEQTIPNVLVIKELGPFDRYVFIRTGKLQNAYNAIKDVCNLNESDCEEIIVSEYSYSDNENKLQKHEFPVDCEITLNSTGGTKIMSAAALNFFKNKYSRIIYLAINANKIRELYPKEKEFPIKYKLNVEEFFNAYNVDIKNIDNPKYEWDVSKNVFTKFSDINKNFNTVLKKLRDYINNRPQKKVGIHEFENLNKLLKTVSLPLESADNIKKSEIRWLTGGWFEEYCYYFFQKKHGLEGKHININAKTKKDNSQNEFDVIFTLDNKLFIIECKTIIFSKINGKNLFNDTLFKLAALRSYFGIAPKGMIVFMDEISDINTDVYYSRAKTLNIDLITKQQLESHADKPD